VIEGLHRFHQYTLTDDAGAVIDSNVDKEPLTYVQGAGQIVNGLEKEPSD
jgi:FKBP-type peptidyl-prolyl cis-trans isomerase SlyD